MTLLLLSVGAFVGAPARYLTDRAIQRRFGRDFPWGTLAVNVAASLVLGLLLGAGRSVSEQVIALAGTGFCGALSTYSTFSFETLRLYQLESRPRAASYLGLTLVVGLGAGAAGWAVATSF